VSLIESLIKDGWLKSPEIIEAFKNIKREDFVIQKELADYNTALPIGYGQTISQPLVVSFMVEKLKPQQGDKILDIGSGSGWTTAILAYLVGNKGRIIALEIIPELKKFGEKNVSKYNFINKGIAEFILGDGSQGYKEESPYDRILCSAEARYLPQALKEQLKVGGTVVIPIGASIFIFEKITENKFEEKSYPGFAFVPLINKEKDD
jgi:protein-L-isoaspartate(D-aspartate) O-methyltransferase